MHTSTVALLIDSFCREQSIIRNGAFYRKFVTVWFGSRIVSVIIFTETYVHVVENRPSVFIEIQMHIIYTDNIPSLNRASRCLICNCRIDLYLRTRCFSDQLAKITYRGFSIWVAILMAHECLVVRCNSGNSYRSQRKTMLRYAEARFPEHPASIVYSFRSTAHEASAMYFEQYDFWLLHRIAN